VKRKVFIGFVVVAILTLVTIAAPVFASGGDPPPNEIVVGPITVVPIIEVTRTSVKIEDVTRRQPGQLLATVSWTVKNLVSEPKYVSQDWWAEGGSPLYGFSIRVEYTVTVATRTIYDNVFLLPPGAQMTLEAKYYLSYDAQPTSPGNEGKLHILDPRVTTAPTISGGKG